MMATMCCDLTLPSYTWFRHQQLPKPALIQGTDTLVPAV